MSQDDEAIGYTANFTAVALTLLVNCLKRQGALEADQFEDAIRATLAASGANKSRLDYQLLENLLQTLERNGPTSPPSAVALH